jgi:hypothetical protein
MPGMAAAIAAVPWGSGAPGTCDDAPSEGLEASLIMAAAAMSVKNDVIGTLYSELGELRRENARLVHLAAAAGVGPCSLLRN